MTDIRSAAVQARLRAQAESLRRKPTPLADLIPLLNEAADALDLAAAPAPQPTMQQLAAGALYPQVSGFAPAPLAPAPQPGWKLVPVEPTADMLNTWAFRWPEPVYADRLGKEPVLGWATVDAIYRAMLAASPSPQHDGPSDAEMLDWLEAMANQRGGLLLHDGTETGRAGLGLRPGCVNRTLREAIRAAMRETGGKTE